MKPKGWKLNPLWVNIERERLAAKQARFREMLRARIKDEDDRIHREFMATTRSARVG